MEETAPRASHLVAMAAHALITREDGRLLVIRRHGTDYLDNFWSVPAGHIESGESAVTACSRELYEEAGIRLDVEDLMFRLVQQKSGSDGEERVDFFFAGFCGDPAQARVGAPYELDAVKWVEPDRLPEPFAPYVLAAMSAIAEGSNFATWDL